eukprot:jgi/Ulvmu1/1558/UM110_0021.1
MLHQSSTHIKFGSISPSRATPRVRATRSVACRAGSGVINQADSIQLGTAKLPSAVPKESFSDGMYQWASTLTSSGQNMPFALPLKADKLPSGFAISFLRVVNGVISIIAKVECVVEDVGEDSVFFARFKAGEDPFPDGRVPPGDSQKRLEVLLDTVVDVPIIMNTMAKAIRKNVATAS